MTSATVVGATGLVGVQILSLLKRHPGFSQATAIVRKPLPNDSADESKVEVVAEPDSSTWDSKIKRTDVFFSALGTTKATAGGVENQRKIDYDLNLKLATAAKNAGVETYVLISAPMADPNAMSPYTKMKGELERDVLKLGFRHTVIIRPGVILGDRAKLEQPSRWAEKAAMLVCQAVGAVSAAASSFLANPDRDIATAAVAAAIRCQGPGPVEGEVDGKIELGPRQIYALAQKTYTEQPELKGP